MTREILKKKIEKIRNDIAVLQEKEKKLVEEEKLAEAVACSKILKIHGITPEEMNKILEERKKENKKILEEHAQNHMDYGERRNIEEDEKDNIGA